MTRTTWCLMAAGLAFAGLFLTQGLATFVCGLGAGACLAMCFDQPKP